MGTQTTLLCRCPLAKFEPRLPHPDLLRTIRTWLRLVPFRYGRTEAGKLDSEVKRRTEPAEQETECAPNSNVPCALN